MNLPTKLVKDFAKIVNDSSSEEKIGTQLYGTVKVITDKKYVQIDGSEVYTPIAEVVDAQDGDRVLVSIENHRATILGNFTYPPSARKEQEALTKSEDAEEKAQEALDATEEYSEQISAANAAAQEAKSNAASANTLATEASAKADQVHTLAEEAKSAAQEAESKAGSAMTNVETANQALSALQTEVSGVKTDISTIRANVQTDLDTFTQTISQNYAAKTDLTTLEGTLTAKINQSVAGLETTFADNYVAKSDHVTITENLQTQINQNAEGISSSAKKITKLETDTSEAQKAIDAAQKDADDALAAAGTAQTKANEAQATANEATAKANAADAALTQAKADLATAQANLAAVTGRVDATEEEIAAAQADVTKAQTAVNKAQADATAAQTAASEAKTAASTATSKAQEAKNAADKAQADADALKSRVDTAETKINQTAESLSLVANRTTAVENKFGDYSTTTQMNAAIEVKANSITSTVAATYATQSGLNTVSSRVTQTENKFSWVIKSGNSSTDFTITDRMATLTAEHINLNGLVTFGGLDSSTQSTINTASTNASQANTKATNAVNQALEAKGDAATAKATADTANSNASAAANQLATWCHANNKTLIDGSKIYTGSITATQIAGKTITAAEIATGTITANEIKAGTITATQIATGTITATQIAGKTITAAEIATATITATQIAGKTITAAEIATGTITANEIKAGTITSAQIATGTITADKISVTSLETISAKIGGFNIGATSIYSGSSSISGSASGSVYLGTDGISCGKNFNVTKEGVFRAHVTLDNSVHTIAIGEDGVVPLVIYDEDDMSDCLNIDTFGIYRDNDKNLYFLNNFEFGKPVTIGTSSKPSGAHYLTNNTAIYAQNYGKTETVPLLLLSEGNHIMVGHNSNKSKSAYVYTGYQQSFNINESKSTGDGATNRFSLYYSSDQTKWVLKVPCVYELTTTNAANVMVSNTGAFWRSTSSSRRYKEAISDKLSEYLDPHKLYAVPVVEYVYKNDYLSKDDQRYGQKVIGFIAEDMADIYPIAASYNEDGLVEDWNSRFIIPGMLKLIQEQHKVDISLNSQVETLKNQLDEAMIKIASLEKQIDILKTA